MSEPVRDAFDAAASRGEPPAGDAFGRFVARRRRSRGVRALSGVAAFVLATAGVIRLFPGIGGDDSDPIAGQTFVPPLSTYRSFEDTALGASFIYPIAWQEQHAPGERVRVGETLGEVAEPTSVEVRVGIRCATADCFWPDAADSGKTFPEQGSVRVSTVSLAFGSTTRQVLALDYPDQPRIDHAGAARWPWCDGCTILLIEQEPFTVLVAAPSLEAIRAEETSLAVILASLRAV